jgi:hypothetical protein
MPETNPLNQSDPGTLILSSPAERMYHAWNEALSRNDAAALTALYAPDAEIESPLIPHLMDLERPIRGMRKYEHFGKNCPHPNPPSAITTEAVI